MPLLGQINEIRDYVSIADLGVNLAPTNPHPAIIGETLNLWILFCKVGLKIGPHQYVRAHHDIFHGFAWRFLTEPSLLRLDAPLR